MFRKTSKLLIFLCLLLFMLIGIGLLLPKPALLTDVDFSRMVLARDGKILAVTLSSDDKYRVFTKLSEVSDQLKQATILHEDQYFYNHFGLNPYSIARAVWKTYLSKTRKIGASTISMQLARLKFKINSKSLNGKILQMMRALQLEWHYSKDEILEAYLNLTPYGGNVEGVGAASLIYYHKKESKLTLPEAISLAVIPQSPLKRTPSLKSDELILARNALFKKWLKLYPSSSDQTIFFALPTAIYKIEDLPFEAPHFVREVLLSTAGSQVTTSLDLNLQHLTEKLSKNYLASQQSFGVNNAAAILINTSNMEVISYLGAANFFNKEIAGQVNGIKAKRSPGSTLKPFIYALAIDQGLIHPASILKDTPSNFGAYSPDNYDLAWHGPISAEEALTHSRNIPAIYLSSKLKNPSFYQFLQNAGISKLQPEEHYGLSLVLGGAAISMQELVELYAMLANLGIEQQVVTSLNAQATGQHKVLSPEASYLTLMMLENTPSNLLNASNVPVYWKSGTSNGFHDAWAAGVFGQYALVVWIGNFDSKSNPALIGTTMAAPLFFQIINALNLQNKITDIISPKSIGLNLGRIDICQVTGDIASPECPSYKQSWFIPGKSPIKKNSIYRKILIDLASGLQACHFISGLTAYKIYEFWPSDILQTFTDNGVIKPKIPGFKPECNTRSLFQVGNAPEIISPLHSVTYNIRVNSPTPPIALTASHDDARELFWFADTTYLGKVPVGKELQWNPIPGEFVIKVVDDQGRSSSRIVKITVTE